MRLLIAAGGTGGHVYPALAPIDPLRAAVPDLQILWVGAKGGMEADLVRRADIPYTAIDGQGVVGVGAFKALIGILRLTLGFFQSIGIVRRFKPDVLFVTGGYTAVAVTLACWLLRVPIAVYLPDVEPGSGVRFVARFARKVLVTLSASRQYFPGKSVVVTGYPLRQEVLSATRISPQEARAQFQLDPHRQTLFVFGGSRGARSLNQAVMQNLPALVNALGLQILHISGTLDWETVKHYSAGLPDSLQSAYRAYPYLHAEMGQAFSAATIVVARAGASTLGELPAFGLPALLVPYPHAWRYQKVNADALAEQGAARRIADETLSQQLLSALRELLQPSALSAMQTASRRLGQPFAAENIARELAELADAQHTFPASGDRPND